MNMHPLGLAVESFGSASDEAILQRWGLNGGKLVDRTALGVQLSRLIVDEAPPPEDPRQLIDWIRVRYHQAHRDALETAIAMANVAEGVHASDEAWPHGLTDQLLDLFDQLEVHQQREDAVIFPQLIEGGAAAADGETIVEAEHDGLSLRLEHLARRTGGFTAPAHACATWRLLFLLCRKIDGDLREQMALENTAFLGRRIRESTEDSDCSAAM